MALTWKWENKQGEITLKGGTKINLYKGNALMIAIWEDEKQYQMYSFFCDKEHMKNCIKDFNPFENWELVEYHKVYKEDWNLIKELEKAGVKIIINTKSPI